MHVVHFITGLESGGAEWLLYSLLEYGKKHDPETKHTVIYAYDGPVKQALTDIGITCMQIKGLVSYADFIGIIKLIYHLIRLNPSVMHTSLWSANIIGKIVGRILGIPVINSLHDNYSKHTLVRKCIEKSITHFFPPKFIISVSHQVEKDYKNILPNNKNYNIVSIYNGVKIQQDATTKDIRKVYSIPSNAILMCSMGRYVPVKGYELLIEAFAEASKEIPQDMRLMLIGQGPLEKKLTELVKIKNLSDKITLTGYQPHDELASFYKACDIYIVSSFSEGMSIALLEALSYGCPIISTSHQPPLHEVIEDQVNGLVIPAQNIQALKHSIISLATKPAIRDSMRKKNTEKGLAEFSIGSTYKSYKRIYQDTTHE